MITKRNVSTIFLILLISLSMTACQEKTDDKGESSIVQSGENSTDSNSIDQDESDESNSSNQGEDMLTREWIMDHYGLTEEEVQGYDIDLMIKHRYLMSQEKTMERYPTKQDFLNSIEWLHEGAYEKEHADELKEANDFTYLLEGTDDFPSSYDQIQYLGLESIWDDRQPGETDPTGKVSALFDFVEKKAYFKASQESVLDDIRNAQEVIDLTDEDIEKIFSLFDETNFSNWPSFKAEEDVYNNWKYGIETKDGKVFSNMVENLPENDQGWKLFTELFGFATHYPVMKK